MIRSPALHPGVRMPRSAQAGPACASASPQPSPGLASRTHALAVFSSTSWPLSSLAASSQPRLWPTHMTVWHAAAAAALTAASTCSWFQGNKRKQEQRGLDEDQPY